jgi:DNA-directed RNA polymerase sigma subunit (sigma70/sigma32)
MRERDRVESIPRGKASRADLAALRKWRTATDQTHDPARIAELREELETRIGELRARDAATILDRFAFGRTLAEIGNEADCSKQRVQQVEERALAHLRSCVEIQ